MKILKKILDYLRKLLPDLLFLFGLLAIVEGIDRIYEPAGVIAMGVASILCAVIWSRGGASR